MRQQMDKKLAKQLSSNMERLKDDFEMNIESQVQYVRR